MRRGRKLDVPLGALVLGGSFFLGGLLGVVLAGFLTEEQGLAQYFQAYFSLVAQGEAVSHLGISLWTNVKAPGLAVLLGFSFLGMVGLPLLFVSEGFLFTFSVATLCRIWGISGLLPGFFLFCLPGLLWVPVLFILGLQSFRAAVLLSGQGRRQWSEIYPGGYFFRCFLCFLVVLVQVALEYWVIPLCLQLTVELI